MQSVKHSISLPKDLSSFLNKLARRIAKERGLNGPNISLTLAEMVVKARNEESRRSKMDLKEAV